MKIKKIIFYLSFLCLFATSLVYGDSIVSSSTAVGKDSGGNGSANSVNFTDPQKPIVVKRNQPIFTVILQANPTTGFSWSLKGYDASLIKPISRTYLTSKKGLIGAGGYEKWIFVVKPAGFIVPQTTSITLIYARSSDLQGAQAVNFKVVTSNDH